MFGRKKSDSFLTEESLVDLLRKIDLLQSLNKRQIKKLASYCEQIFLNEGETLFRKDDPSDAMYILSSGQLAAILPSGPEDKIIGLINPGETVGELGGFSRCSRSLTVKTLTDSVLIKLSRDDINYFLDKYASADLYMKLVDTIINRSQSVIKLLGDEKMYRHCIIVPCSEQPVMERFIELLKKNIQPRHRILLVDKDYLQQHNIEKNIENVTKIMKKADEENVRVLFVIRQSETLSEYLEDYKKNQVMSVFQNIDGIYVVADAKSKPALNEPVKELFNGQYAPFVSRKELVLLHDPETSIPAGFTKQWLAIDDFTFHHHLRLQDADCCRFLRFVLEKPNAVVLGGGGVRGWASVGVIKAIQEYGIPIDAIGGTSAGSIFAAGFARQLDYQAAHEMLKPFEKIGYKMFSMKHLTFPLVSITNAKYITEAFRRVFDALQAEDLWLPYFSISANLNTGKEVFQNRGLLWETLRGSASIPLVYPPFVREGQLYVDGGLLNNLPVDRMRQFVGKKSFVFAVNLTPFFIREQYDFPPVITFTNGLLRRLNISKHRYKYPAMFDTLLKALMVGALSKTIENSKNADLLVNPDMSHISFLNLPIKKINILIERGYSAAMQQLERIEVDPQTKIISFLEKR
jgi:NTE family protein